MICDLENFCAFGTLTSRIVKNRRMEKALNGHREILSGQMRDVREIGRPFRCTHAAVQNSNETRPRRSDRDAPQCARVRAAPYTHRDLPEDAV